MCKALQQKLLNINGNSFKVCTPTHKSALIANATTIFNLFNRNPIDHTYLKTTVENLKQEGVKWIFVRPLCCVDYKRKLFIYEQGIYGDQKLAEQIREQRNKESGNNIRVV